MNNHLLKVTDTGDNILSLLRSCEKRPFPLVLKFFLWRSYLPKIWHYKPHTIRASKEFHSKRRVSWIWFDIDFNKSSNDGWVKNAANCSLVVGIAHKNLFKKDSFRFKKRGPLIFRLRREEGGGGKSLGGLYGFHGERSGKMVNFGNLNVNSLPTPTPPPPCGGGWGFIMLL